MANLNINTPEVFLPLLDNARYLCCYGGRGSGKSHFFAELLVERCLTACTKAVCVREIQKSLKQSVKALIEDKIKQLGVSHLFTCTLTEIRNNFNGSLIIFQGLQDHTADSIKSLEGFDIAFVEEAQSLSQHSLDLLRPTIRKIGSQLWFAWNPRHATDPVDVLFRGENPPNDMIIVNSNYYNNPYLSEEMIAELERDQLRDNDKFNHVWLGHYQEISEAAVFKNFKVLDFETPPGMQFKIGLDFGYAQDPSAIIRCYQIENALYIDYEGYDHGVEIVNLPNFINQIPGSDKIYIIADSSRPETISYLNSHGYTRVTGSKKGPGSIMHGIEYLKSLDIIVHPRCKNMIDEFNKYAYVQDKHTGILTNKLPDKDNHLIDALRYAIEINTIRARKSSSQQEYVNSGWL